MSDLGSLLWLIPGLPLAAAFLTAFLGPRLLRRHSHWPCVVAVAGAFACSVPVLLAVSGGGHEAAEGGHAPAPNTEVVSYYDWIRVAEPAEPGDANAPHGVNVRLSLRADPLSAIMVTMVTFIGTLIAVFSIGYMRGDPGYPRFFAEVALFVFSMNLLVLADNFILLYAGWEGVGVCSYLLIGFWFNKSSAADAARKAFLVTRIGDVGLMLGILLLWYWFGYHFDFGQTVREGRLTDGVFGAVQAASDSGRLAPGSADYTALLVACLLLFLGAAGKSAQFPLHVWLPDAMEGPTPVSALIHAATMVTAGVYLVARCTPLFALVPEAQLTVACIGGFTALFAALIGLTQNDLKRVLAYSTLSQLGYMFLALGCAVAGGTRGLVVFAVVAAVFHLFTHAFFKALLFLAAGSVMHAMGNVIDMRRFAGLRKVLPATHWTFLAGALALAGFPGLAGFWSKDEILGATHQAGETSGRFGGVYYLLFLAAVVTAFLTAFYTFRAYFMTFWGELRVPPEAGSHGHGGHDEAHGHEPHAAGHDDDHGHAAGVAHESPPVMTVPLMVLAAFAVFVGFAVGPLTNSFAHLLGSGSIFSGFTAPAHELDWPLMGTSAVVALAGIGLAWLMYVRQTDLPGRLAASARALYELSYNKFHVDELYDYFLVKPLEGVAQFCRIFDQYVVDSLVDIVGNLPRLLGALFRPVQNGLVQFYALAMVLGLTVFLVALVRWM